MEDVAANRYHDHATGTEVVSIVVGGCVVSADPRLVITTTLGSCVAACLFDPGAEVGGMNHFLLPDAGDDRLSASARYGSAAMEQLISRLIAITGRRDRLRAKVFGGADVNGLSHGIGGRNVDFVNAYLKHEGIRIVGADVGGSQARALRFYPTSGRSQRRLIAGNRCNGFPRSEAGFMERLRNMDIDGGIELF